MEQELLTFLQEQKLVAIATVDEAGKPWLCNVYYSITPQGQIFFASSPKTKHSQHIMANKDIAFTVSWYDKENLENRKAVQGLGVCEKITDPLMAIRFLTMHYEFFPDWRDVLTVGAVRKKVLAAKYYVITPSYMKFWNDELFGEEGAKEYQF